MVFKTCGLVFFFLNGARKPWVKAWLLSVEEKVMTAKTNEVKVNK